MVSIWGALVALAIAIFLIIKKVHPAYALVLGSVVGGLVGGLSLVQTVSLMISGTQGMIPAILRILMAGVLAGVLIESGAAARIATTIVRALGQSRAIICLVLAAAALTAVGVFIDIAVITIAPIALMVAKQANISKTGILVAMIGGGKSGNVISPNPQSIAAADTFEVPLTSIMAAGIIPAIFGIVFSIVIATFLSKKGAQLLPNDVSEQEEKAMPPLWASLVAPVVAIGLLALRPTFNIIIDPLVALPVGGVMGALSMGKIKHINKYCATGIARMSFVAIFMIGTGTLAGIIANSELRDVFTNFLAMTGAPAFLLAPLAGIVMSAATASTTSGTIVGSAVFGETLLAAGIAPVSAGAMILSGATVLDHLPHGSFFHATGGSVNMDIKDRLKVIPYETAVGLVLTFVSTMMFCGFGFVIG